MKITKTNENGKSGSSKSRKKLALFHAKFTSFENILLSLESKINELEASHRKLIDQTEAKMTNVSAELKAVREELRIKDRRINELVVKLEVLEAEVKGSKVNCEVDGHKTTSARAQSFRHHADELIITKRRKKSSYTNFVKPEHSISPTPTNVKGSFKSQEKVKVEVKPGEGEGEGDGGLIKPETSLLGEKRKKDGEINPVDDPVDSNETKGFECPVCGEEFKSLKKVGRHLKSHDRPIPKLSSPSTCKLEAKRRSFKCETCLRELCSASSLKRHSKIFHNNLRLDQVSTTVSARLGSLAYTCNLCAELFPTWSNFKSRLSDSHTAMHEDLFCSTKSIPSAIQGCPPVIKFACRHCPKTCDTKDILKVHVTEAHMWKKPFVCKIEGCTRSFFTSEFLCRHRKCHGKIFD